MSKKILAMISGDIFYSNLVCCLAVFGNVRGLLNYRDGPTMAGMTSENCNKLQVIQNSLNRAFTGARKGTPTTDLMQMVAYGVPHLVNGAQGNTDWQTREHCQEAEH